MLKYFKVINHWDREKIKRKDAKEILLNPIPIFPIVQTWGLTTDEKIAIEIYNKIGRDHIQLTIMHNNNYIDNNTPLTGGANNEYADRVHEINYKKGDKIVLYANEEGLYYNISIK